MSVKKPHHVARTEVFVLMKKVITTVTVPKDGLGRIVVKVCAMLVENFDIWKWANKITQNVQTQTFKKKKKN